MPALGTWWTHLWTSGPLRNLLEASWYNTEKPKLFPEPKIWLPIYKSLPPDHSGTPRDIQDLIRDSEQHSVTVMHMPILLKRQQTLSVWSYGFENNVDMTETPLSSIINSGTWMPILIPTYSMKIFIGWTMMSRIQLIPYAIPFVQRYVTCPRFDRRYLHT